MVVVLLGLLTLLSACSTATPTGPEAARALVEESAAAMGGWAALDAVKSQEILTGGGEWEPMQAVEPTGEARAINTFGQSLVADFEKNRFRLTFDAIRVYPNRSPVKFAEVIDGDTGMLESLDANGKVVRERLHPSRLAARLRDLRRLPIRLLHTAKNAPELTRLEDKIDEERMRTLIQNPKYDEASMVIPEEIRSQPENGERIVSQWPLRRVVMGVGYQDFGRAQKVEFVEVSKGVYHVKGSSHHSMAIEMKDHLIVVEAPLYEER